MLKMKRAAPSGAARFIWYERSYWITTPGTTLASK